MSNSKPVEEWSVKEVTAWLESISLGHKSDVIEEKGIDGAKLAATSSDDLKDFGFSGLQCKKIQRELDNLKNSGGSAAAGAASTSSGADTATLSAENAALRQELDELKGMVAAMQAESGATAAAPTSKYDFCAKTVIEGAANNQTMTVTMTPDDVLYAEPGAMLHMSPYIHMEAELKGGGGFLARAITGEKWFRTKFTYQGPAGTADQVTLAPDFPSQIVAIKLQDYRGGKIICQRGSFMCSGKSVTLNIELTKSLGTGFFGGEGFILQGLQGHGYVFLNARGRIVKKVLREKEHLTVATGALVGFESSVKYNIRGVGGGLKTYFWGGEGIFLADMTGPGTVWIETHDIARLFVAMNRQQGSNSSGGGLLD